MNYNVFKIYRKNYKNLIGTGVYNMIKNSETYSMVQS